MAQPDHQYGEETMKEEPRRCNICDGELVPLAGAPAWGLHTPWDCLLELRRRIDQLEIDRDLKKAFDT